MGNDVCLSQALRDAGPDFQGMNPHNSLLFISGCCLHPSFSSFLAQLSICRSSSPCTGPLTNQRRFQCSTPTLKIGRQDTLSPHPVFEPSSHQWFNLGKLMQHLSASHQLSNHQLGVSRVSPCSFICLTTMHY